MKMKILIFDIIFILFNKANPKEFDIGKGSNVVYTSSNRMVNESSNVLDSTINKVYFASFFENISNYPDNIGVWIQVDLNWIFNISKVIVLAPNDINYIKSGDFVIYVRFNNKTRYNPDDGYIGEFGSCVDNFSQGSYKNFTKINGSLGRFVTLKKLLNNRYQDFVIAGLIIISEDEDFQIIGLKNASQNNLYNSDQSYVATNAIDGDLSTCSFTAQPDDTRNINGWWLVDLGTTYKIVSVRIDNSVYNKHIDLARLEIYVLQSEYSTPIFCASYSNEANNLQFKTTIRCIQPVEGRYVKIVKNGVTRIDNLLLCDVNIYASKNAPELVLPTDSKTMTSSTSHFLNLTSPNNTTSYLTPTFTFLFPISNITSSTISKNITSLFSTTFSTNEITAEKGNSSNVNKTPIIIGCIVGILAAIIIAIIIVIICKKCRKKKKVPTATLR